MPVPLGTDAATDWRDPMHEIIEPDRWYIVQTNGMEWRDFDLMIMRGALVSQKLDPRYVRGRPIRIAKVLGYTPD